MQSRPSSRREPGVSAAIVGARSPEQVDSWIGAANLELTPLDLEEIATAINRTARGVVLPCRNRRWKLRVDGTSHSGM